MQTLFQQNHTIIHCAIEYKVFKSCFQQTPKVLRGRLKCICQIPIKSKSSTESKFHWTWEWTHCIAVKKKADKNITQFIKELVCSNYHLKNIAAIRAPPKKDSQTYEMHSIYVVLSTKHATRVYIVVMCQWFIWLFFFSFDSSIQLESG